MSYYAKMVLVYRLSHPELALKYARDVIAGNQAPFMLQRQFVVVTAP